MGGAFLPNFENIEAGVQPIPHNQQTLMDLDKREDLIQLVKSNEWMTALKNKLMGYKEIIAVNVNGKKELSLIRDENALVNMRGAEDVFDLMSEIASIDFKIASLKKFQFHKILLNKLNQISELLFHNAKEYMIKESKLSSISLMLKNLAFALITQPTSEKIFNIKEFLRDSYSETVFKKYGEQTGAEGEGKRKGFFGGMLLK